MSGIRQVDAARRTTLRTVCCVVSTAFAENHPAHYRAWDTFAAQSMTILWLTLAMLLQTQPSSAVSGTVTKPGGNEPLAGATITLVPLGPEAKTPRRTANSEDDGHFAIRNVVPGEYRLAAESARYGTVVY